DMPMNTYACAVRRVRPPATMPAAPPAGGVEHDDSRRGEPLDGTQTSPVVLADLEHVLRLPGHPVRIRPAECQCQPHLPDAGRGHGAGARPVDRRTADRPAGADGGRLPVRPHLDAAGKAPDVLPSRRGAGDVRPVLLASTSTALE